MDSDSVIKAALAPVGEMFVEPPLPIIDHIPCVVASLIDGESPWVDVLERPRYTIEAWAESRQDAQLLAQSAIAELVAAWRSQQPLAGSALNFVRVNSRPVPVDSGIKGVYRSLGTVTLSIRPA